MPYEFIHKRLKTLFSSNFIGYSLVRLSGFWLKANSYRRYIYDPSRDSFFEPLFFGGGVAKNTGVGCHSLIQEIFPTQGLNPGRWLRWTTQEVQPRGATPHPRSGAATKRARLRRCSQERPKGATPHPKTGEVAERSNPTSKERRVHGCRRAERSYSMFKVRRGN